MPQRKNAYRVHLHYQSAGNKECIWDWAAINWKLANHPGRGKGGNVPGQPLLMIWGGSTSNRSSPPYFGFPEWSEWVLVSSQPLVTCLGKFNLTEVSLSSNSHLFNSLPSIQKLSTRPKMNKKMTLQGLCSEGLRWEPLSLIGLIRHHSSHSGDPQSHLAILRLLVSCLSSSPSCSFPASLLLHFPSLSGQVTWAPILSRFQTPWFELLRSLFPLPQMFFFFISLRNKNTFYRACHSPAEWTGSCPLPVVDHNLTQSQTIHLLGLASPHLPLKDQISTTIATYASIQTWTTNCRGVRVRNGSLGHALGKRSRRRRQSK